jgi:hypothetical protein
MHSTVRKASLLPLADHHLKKLQTIVHGKQTIDTYVSSHHIVEHCIIKPDKKSLGAGNVAQHDLFTCVIEEVK